jgi:uncharacterized protein (TIGR04255 family)
LKFKNEETTARGPGKVASTISLDYASTEVAKSPRIRVYGGRRSPMKYQKAPITEAVMDIRVAPRFDLDMATLASVGAGTDFSEVGDLFSVTGAISLGAPATQTITPAKEGFRFSTKAGGRVFQAQRNGWSFSKLAPYESWEAFSSEGRELWRRYRDATRPEAIDRVALRYINRLDLPLPVADFKEYILTSPEVAPALPQQLSGFLMQLHIPQFDINAMTVLNLALVPPPGPDICSILLDIDVFRTADAPQADDELWAYLEKLRERKNFVFEACITEKMRRRFE